MICFGTIDLFIIYFNGRNSLAGHRGAKSDKHIKYLSLNPLICCYWCLKRLDEVVKDGGPGVLMKVNDLPPTHAH